MDDHVIILPDPSKFPQTHFGSHWRTSRMAACLKILPTHYPNIKVVTDTNNFHNKLPPFVHMANRNGQYSGFFMVDDNLFMVADTDWPIKNHEIWVPHYEKWGVKGFFLACPRYSTEFIFKDSKVPVFPLGGKPGPGIPLSYMEGRAHADAMQARKTVPVSFCGNLRSRMARLAAARNIRKYIPNSVVRNIKTSDPRGTIDGLAYIELMKISEIIWCPRSGWSNPEHDCNAPIGREFEAMCLENIVIKHSIGTKETEIRIPGIHFVEIQNDDSDLIEKIQYYLEHENERKEIAYNGRLYYEKNCSSLARANKLLNSCLGSINI